VEEGGAIEFTADSFTENVNTIQAVEDINVKFKVTDITTGTPLTRSWKVMMYIDAGITPTRITLQPDQQYVSVGNDSNEKEGGVTVIDTMNLKVIAKIPTGWTTPHRDQQRQSLCRCLEQRKWNRFSYRHTQTGKTQ
jgi:YVTN family beta-propeller protein